MVKKIQNNNFDEVDYSKINFDIEDKDIFLYSENKDKTPVTENYFTKSFIFTIRIKLYRNSKYR